MSVKVEVDQNLIKTKMNKAWKKGLGMLSSQILKDCNRYCKEDTWMLIISSLIHSDLDNGKLVWNTPYAARQYYEIQTAYHDKNPEASWMWCDVAKQQHLDDWNKQAQAITKYYP